MPNSSRPVKASVSSATRPARRPRRRGRAGRSAAAGSSGSGSCAVQAAIARVELSDGVRALTARRRCRPAGCAAGVPPRARPRAPRWWFSGSGEMPAARLVTSEMPSTSSPASRAAIGLQGGGHADQVAAEDAGHPHLGRRLVLRSAELHVDPLGQLRVDRRGRGRAAGARTPRSGRRRWRRAAGVAPVRLMWSRISTGVPGRPVAVQAAAAVGEHQDRRRPRRPRSAYAVHHRRDVAALVEVGAPGEDRRRSCRSVVRTTRRAPPWPSDGGRGEAGQLGQRAARRSARPDRRRPPTSRSRARRPASSPAMPNRSDRVRPPGPGRAGRSAWPHSRVRVSGRRLPADPRGPEPCMVRRRPRRRAPDHQPLEQERDRSSAT